MGVIMIKCPRSGRAITTGMNTDRETFQCRALFFSRTYCTTCRITHEWFARDAWVYEPEEMPKAG